MKKQPVTLETIIVLVFFILGFILFSSDMGVANFLNTMINTSFYLLINVALWIMAVAVLTGAMAGIFSEFGIIALLNYAFSFIVRIIYRLPGVAGIGALSAYLSDNPAVISLYKEREFRKQFKNYQVPVLVNLGTSFGMGLVIAIFFIALDSDFSMAVGIGVFASIIGSIVSVRMLTYYSKKYYKIPKDDNPIKVIDDDEFLREVREGSFVNRFLESALDGGKNGVEIGLQIIPGILIISTFIMMLTYGQPVDAFGNILEYTGSAKEGIALLPTLGNHIMFIMKPLFGFTSSEAIAFPLISLGSAGAAIGIVPDFIKAGFVSVKDIAVFTAIGTTWSGYLSTHVGMMDTLGVRPLTTKAIFSHTIGGIVSGVVANYLFILISALL